MTYTRLKILNQYLEKGLTNKSNWGVITPKGVPGRETDYDEALHLLGFDKYLVEILEVEEEILNLSLHLTYLTIIGSYLGESTLNSYELKLVKDNTEVVEKIAKLLENSEIFMEEKSYYNTRIPLTRKEYAGTLMLTYKYIDKIGEPNSRVGLNSVLMYKPPIENNSVEIGRVKPNGDFIVAGFDLKSAKYFRETSIGYKLHIPPFLYSKLVKYMPTVTNKPETIYSAFENPTAEDFEAIFLLYLEYELSKDSKGLNEFLKPLMSLGEALNNRVCVAYSMPEVPGELEYYKVVFRYGNDINLITDKEHLQRVMDLKGLYYEDEENRDPNESPMLREERVSVWDYMFIGAYRPKNGNENDIRTGNLMK